MGVPSAAFEQVVRFELHQPALPQPWPVAAGLRQSTRPLQPRTCDGAALHGDEAALAGLECRFEAQPRAGIELEHDAERKLEARWRQVVALVLTDIRCSA